MSPTDSPHDPAATSRSLLLAAGLVLLVQGFSLFAPMAVLGNAIQWPDSLDYPPAKMLPLLRAQLDGVRLGYGLYLGYSLLFLVGWTVLLLAWWFLGLPLGLGASYTWPR